MMPEQSTTPGLVARWRAATDDHPRRDAGAVTVRPDIDEARAAAERLAEKRR
jgi:hypothetical protein